MGRKSKAQKEQEEEEAMNALLFLYGLNEVLKSEEKTKAMVGIIKANAEFASKSLKILQDLEAGGEDNGSRP